MNMRRLKKKLRRSHQFVVLIMTVMATLSVSFHGGGGVGGGGEEGDDTHSFQVFRKKTPHLATTFKCFVSHANVPAFIK